MRYITTMTKDDNGHYTICHVCPPVTTCTCEGIEPSNNIQKKKGGSDSTRMQCITLTMRQGKFRSLLVFHEACKEI